MVAVVCSLNVQGAIDEKRSAAQPAAVHVENDLSRTLNLLQHRRFVIRRCWTIFCPNVFRVLDQCWSALNMRLP
jgi:hypothetical protein